MDEVRPFRIEVPDAAIADLRARLRATRWPERETVADRSQGVPLDELQRLCRHWAEAYDWRVSERRLNAVPQVVTSIGGLELHAFHVRSPHPGAVPLVLTHGWPGSFVEFERVWGLLADPVAEGGDAAEAFHVVVPSLPGYGWSGAPRTTGWDVHRIARAWAVLMERLGYERFVAAGSDWGTSVSTSLALQQPHRILGLHLVPPLVAPPPGLAPTAWERDALDDLARRQADSGYSAIQATRPQTIGYSLTDSPAGLAAWIVDRVWEWADHDGDLFEVLDRDSVLDNLSVYWFTATGASAARLYRESIDVVTRWFTEPAADHVTVPTSATVFPREVPRPSRRWATERFRDLRHWGSPPRGGHFGAWEQPDLFAAELRAGARHLRNAPGTPTLAP